MRSPQGMVFAICHEVGNLLAAIRLHGELLDPDSGRKVAELSARSGSLISLVRPLLEEASHEPMALDPAGLLSGLRAGLDDPDDPRLEIVADPGLPPVRADGEALYHLLLCEVFAAFEQLGSGERLRFAAELRGGKVVFELTGGAPVADPGPDDRLAGRALCLVLADTLLGRDGADVRVEAVDGRQRVAFSLPLA